MNADIVATSVGLDYAENVVQVMVVDPAGRILGARWCPNNQAAIMAYGQCFGPVAGAAIEACCGAAALTDVLVQEYGWRSHSNNSSSDNQGSTCVFRGIRGASFRRPGRIGYI